MLSSRIRVKFNLEGEEREGYLVEIVVIRDTPLGVVSVRGRGLELFYLNDLREIFPKIPKEPEVPCPNVR